jgi:hypothetical protein
MAKVLKTIRGTKTRYFLSSSYSLCSSRSNSLSPETPFQYFNFLRLPFVFYIANYFSFLLRIQNNLQKSRRTTKKVIPWRWLPESPRSIQGCPVPYTEESCLSQRGDSASNKSFQSFVNRFKKCHYKTQKKEGENDDSIWSFRFHTCCSIHRKSFVVNAILFTLRFLSV